MRSESSMANLATLFGCSLQHIRNMNEKSLIPGQFRFGTLVKFNRQIVNDWLASQGKGAASNG